MASSLCKKTKNKQTIVEEGKVLHKKWNYKHTMVHVYVTETTVTPNKQEKLIKVKTKSSVPAQ